MFLGDSMVVKGTIFLRSLWQTWLCARTECLHLLAFLTSTPPCIPHAYPNSHAPSLPQSPLSLNLRLSRPHSAPSPSNSTNSGSIHAYTLSHTGISQVLQLSQRRSGREHFRIDEIGPHNHCQQAREGF